MNIKRKKEKRLKGTQNETEVKMFLIPEEECKILVRR